MELTPQEAATLHWLALAVMSGRVVPALDVPLDLGDLAKRLRQAAEGAKPNVNPAGATDALLESMAAAVKRHRNPNRCPYGYRREAGRTLPDKQEQQAIRIARQMRGRGATYRAIGARLDREGCKPRKGGEWHPETVRAMLEKAMEDE